MGVCCPNHTRWSSRLQPSRLQQPCQTLCEVEPSETSDSKSTSPLGVFSFPTGCSAFFAAYCWHSQTTAVVLPAAVQPGQPPYNTLQRPPPPGYAAVLLVSPPQLLPASTTYHNPITAVLPCAPTVNHCAHEHRNGKGLILEAQLTGHPDNTSSLGCPQLPNAAFPPMLQTCCAQHGKEATLCTVLAAAQCSHVSVQPC